MDESTVGISRPFSIEVSHVYVFSLTFTRARLIKRSFMESRLGKEWSFELRVVCETCESSNVLFIEKRSSYRGNFFFVRNFLSIKV